MERVASAGQRTMGIKMVAGFKIYNVMRDKAIKLVVWLCMEFDIEIDDIKDKIK